MRTSAASSPATPASATMCRAQGIESAPSAGEPRFRMAHTPPKNTSPISTAHINTKPTRANPGQPAKLWRHHGSAARRESSPSTCSSRLGGAERSGNSHRAASIAASNRRSASVRSLLMVESHLFEERKQCGAGAPYVGFDLGERDAELRGDLLVREVLEVIQHERQALMLGQAAQGLFDRRMLLLRAELAGGGIGHRRLGYFRLLGEQTPAL